MLQNIASATGLELIQESREFFLKPDDIPVTAQTFRPAPERGRCPGNTQTLRVWQILRPGTTTARNCTRAETALLEQLLGEWEQVGFIEHPSLGQVCVEITEAKAIEAV